MVFIFESISSRCAADNSAVHSDRTNGMESRQERKFGCFLGSPTMKYKIINKKKHLATALADGILSMLFLPICLFIRKEPIRPEGIREILVIRTAYIGDVIMTLPILKPLKALYHGANLSFLTGSNSVPILENNPFVDRIITYDAFWFYPKSFKTDLMTYWRCLKTLRSRSYDLIIEARGDIRDIMLLAFMAKGRYRVSYAIGGGDCLLSHVVPFEKVKHKVDYHLDIVRYLGGNTDPLEWHIYLTELEELEAMEILNKNEQPTEGPVVAIHPGARKELKRWSPAGFASVADMLIDNLNASVLLMGGPKEVELVKGVAERMKNKVTVLAGETTLREMAALLKSCALFICNDSSPLHVASVMKTPTVAIFGPSDSNETGPYQNAHRVVQKEFPCRHECDESVCTHEVYHGCMRAITPYDVYNAIRELIG